VYAKLSLTLKNSDKKSRNIKVTLFGIANSTNGKVQPSDADRRPNIPDINFSHHTSSNQQKNTEESRNMLC
jgi:hypothetical protein